MHSIDHAVRAEGLGKRFGPNWALRQVDFEVARGRVMGLLGRNGAGKTTTVRILTTLLRPDEGRAFVDGLDVVRQAARVRPRIGLAGQQATVDELLTGRANLEMIGRLYHLPRRVAHARATQLLASFDLTDAAGKPVKTYSGGMRRRLDLAARLVATPPVLFLDEPTTGLDPHSRSDLWTMLRELVSQGTTLVLTTQYLDEADRLADDIIVVDHGRVIAQGAPDQLKARVGGRRVVVTLDDPTQLARTAETLALVASSVSIDHEALLVTAPLNGRAGVLDVARALDQQGVPATDVSVRTPSLDDVFLTLTGRDAEEREAA